MISRIGFVFAVAALVTAGNASLSFAQSSYHDGYGFGTGFGVGNQLPYDGAAAQHGRCHSGYGLLPFGTINFAPRVEEPPYFAKFPPVYYSHIVRRPYGVSPYAAPPGIAPVEMAVPAPVPLTIANPHYGETPVEALPAADKTEPMLDETKKTDVSTAAGASR